MLEDFNLIDDTGDKKYFTMVPNFILDSVGGIGQALYLQLKRIAGERGKAYPSQAFLMKRLDITRNTLRNELKKLEEAKLILHDGFTEVMTVGGLQKIKTFKIVDVWVRNANFYVEAKGGQNTPTLFDKGGQNNAQGGSKNEGGEGENSASKKNHTKKNIELATTLFNSFWISYPKKVGKGQAERSWFKYCPDQSLADTILASVELHKKTRQWKEDNGKYIPNPSTFLNGKRWEDEIDVVVEDLQDNGTLVFGAK